MKKYMIMVCMVLTLILAACSQETSTKKQSTETTKTDFPKKSIEIVVPYPAGGSTDLAARVLADSAQKYIPNEQSIVVVNKPGGAATVGAADVFQAKPDGYKVMYGAIGNITVQEHYGKVPYTHKDFDPILLTTSLPTVLVVKADSPWKTFEEWLEYTKVNPGKFTYGHTGVGNAQHITVESLQKTADIKLKQVPFEGAVPAINALMGGHVDGTVLVLNDVKPHIDSGELRVLVNFSDSKPEGYEDIPLISEKGIKVKVNGTGHYAFTTTKGTPQEVIDILHDTFKKALEDPATIEQFEKMQMKSFIDYGDGDRLRSIMEEHSKANGEIIEELGLSKK